MVLSVSIYPSKTTFNFKGVAIGIFNKFISPLEFVSPSYKISSPFNKIIFAPDKTVFSILSTNLKDIFPNNSSLEKFNFNSKSLSSTTIVAGPKKVYPEIIADTAITAPFLVVKLYFPGVTTSSNIASSLTVKVKSAEGNEFPAASTIDTYMLTLTFETIKTNKTIKAIKINNKIILNQTGGIPLDSKKSLYLSIGSPFSDKKSENA